MARVILSMADVAACPDVLKPLKSIAKVIELPANQEVLLERIHQFDAFLTSLTVETNREVLQNRTGVPPHWILNQARCIRTASSPH